MKRIKIAASILALLVLMALNFRHASNGYGILQQDAWASGSTDNSGGSNGNNGPSGPSKPGNPGNPGDSGDSKDSGSVDRNSNCCNWWGNFWGTCDEKTESRLINVDCRIITTFYYDANGYQVGTGIIKYGKVTASYSGSFARTTSISTGFIMYNVTKVNCPTNGGCNNCSEYTPPCN